MRVLSRLALCLLVSTARRADLPMPGMAMKKKEASYQSPSRVIRLTVSSKGSKLDEDTAAGAKEATTIPYAKIQVAGPCKYEKALT